MKRIVIYVLWLDVEKFMNADENKFRYNLRQFAKVIQTFESEDFDVDIHIISCEGEKEVAPPLKKILQIAKKQNLLKNFKTLALNYGHRLIDLKKFATDFCIKDDIYITKSSESMERHEVFDKNIDDIKIAKLWSKNVKNDAKTSTLYKYLKFGRVKRIDIVEEKLSIGNIIGHIKSTLYTDAHKIISSEVCISDFAGLNRELYNSGVVNIVLPEQKQYSILVSNKSKELPASFSLEGHKLLHLLYALDIASGL